MKLPKDIFAKFKEDLKLIARISTFKKKMRSTPEGPVKVKLPKGTIPSYISLTSTQSTAWKLFGKMANNRLRKNKNRLTLEENLIKAHMMLRAEEFMAYVYFMTIITVISFIGIFLFLLIFKNLFLILMGAAALVFVPIIVFAVLSSKPSSITKARKKDIESKLSPTMNFISALSSANVTPDVIFKELAKRSEYGEISKEAEWITRDTELLGKDILTAIKDASRRSPSSKWTDFLQGMVTTSTSGGRLKPYFLAKADEFEKEVRLQMKKTMETMSLFAETFVTVGVAFPLFLIIIIAIMALINAAMAPTTVLILDVIVFVMLPVIIGMFVFFIHSTSKEVTS